MTFDLDRNKSISLSVKDKAIRHIDHAWATTTHAYQGKTVNHAILVMPSRFSPLTSLKSLYTGASRHRQGVTIVTDDADKLRINIERQLQIDNVEDNIKWPVHEARMAREAKIQQGPKFKSQRDYERSLEKQPEKEISREPEYQQQISFGR